MGYNITNVSSQSQQRWCTVAVPKATADSLPTVCKMTFPSGTGVFPNPCIAVKGRTLGDLTTLFYVRCKLPGQTNSPRVYKGGVLSAASSQTLPSIQYSSWLTDIPGQAQFWLAWFRASGTNPTELGYRKLSFRSLEENNSVKQTWCFATEGADDGMWAEVYATVWYDQDVVDIEGRWGWASWVEPEWYTQIHSLVLATSNSSEINGVEVPDLQGEPFHLYWGPQMHMRQALPNVWTMFGSHITGKRCDGQMPSWMANHFHGVLLPEDDLGQSINQQVRVQREQWLEAAKGGPVLMVGDEEVWDGHFLALGETPQLSSQLDDGGWNYADHLAAYFLNKVSRPDPRAYGESPHPYWNTNFSGSGEYNAPYHLNYNIGGPGTATHFKIQIGAISCSIGDPLDQWNMLWNLGDFGLRAFHFRDPDNTRFTPLHSRVTGTGWFAYGGSTSWTLSGIQLGKDMRLKGSDSWRQTRLGPGGTHAAFTWPYVCYMLTGSWVARETIYDLVMYYYGEVRNRWGNWDTLPWTTSADDAGKDARGLRTISDLIHTYLLMDGDARQAALDLSDWYFRGMEARYVPNGEVKPINILDPGRTSARVTSNWNIYATQPYQEGIAAMHLIQYRQFAKRFLDDSSLVARVDPIIDQCTYFVANHSFIYNTGTTYTWVIRNAYGVRYFISSGVTGLDPEIASAEGTGFWCVPRQWATYGPSEDPRRSGDYNLGFGGANIEDLYMYGVVAWGENMMRASGLGDTGLYNIQLANVTNYAQKRDPASSHPQHQYDSIRNSERWTFGTGLW